MKLVLKNIGMLKNATVTLQPLSVIAGENDNGKSTVGKIMFCIVKAINRYKEDLHVSKENEINIQLEALFFEFRRSFTRSSENSADIVSEFRSILVRDDAWHDKLQKINEIIDTSKIEGRQLEKIKFAIIDITKLVEAPENKTQSIEKAFDRIFAAEFDSKVLFDGASEGAIQLFENDILLISLKIDSKNKVKLLNDVEPIEIKDATLIESPLIFNNYDLLLRSQTLLDIGRKAMSRLGLPYTTLHTKDLFDKLCEPYYLPDLFLSDFDESLLQKLQDIISGYITYDRKERDFVFKREDRNIGIKNTASGIKTFGLLQILFVNQFIGKNSILIFDEPENHLHPKWQLKLAEILVELAKTGTYILIASHSPYMIEALQRYSEHSKHGAQARFYMAEGNEIIDRNRLDDIFHLLSEPFEEFRKIDSEILSNE